MKGNVSSRLFILSGGLMTLSGALMIMCGRRTVGICFLTSAACLFITAYQFHLAQKNEEEKDNDETAL